MKKKLIGILVLLATAVLSGYLLNKILNLAGLEEDHPFDLHEDIDEELF